MKEMSLWFHLIFLCDQAAVCRCSQPLSGFSARCLEDEHMLQAISKANHNNRCVYVMDTRPKVALFWVFFFWFCCSIKQSGLLNPICIFLVAECTGKSCSGERLRKWRQLLEYPLPVCRHWEHPCDERKFTETPGRSVRQIEFGFQFGCIVNISLILFSYLS